MAKLSKLAQEGLKGLTVQSVGNNYIELSDDTEVTLSEELIDALNEDYGEDEEETEDDE